MIYLHEQLDIRNILGNKMQKESRNNYQNNRINHI